MTDVTEQLICIQFCFKHGKTASENHRMHKETFGDICLCQTQTYERFAYAFQEWTNISLWKRVFFKTIDRNHERKCDESLTSKASCIMSLFHNDRRWMENSIATFWGDWWKTSGTNLYKSGTMNSGPLSWKLSGSRVSRFAPVFVFYEDKSSPPSQLTGHCLLWFFLFPKMK